MESLRKGTGKGRRVIKEGVLLRGTQVLITSAPPQSLRKS